MRKIPIEGWCKKHLLSLLDWVLEEIMSSCGDGDTTIVLRMYSLEDFRTLVVEWIKDRSIRWEVTEIKDDRCFSAGSLQEGLVVTTSRNDVPEWSQCTIEL